MSNAHDRIYQDEAVPEDFEFNERVVEVFDDMLDRSIPFYHEVIRASAQLINLHLESGDMVCDLGCSTGTPLLELSRLLKDKKLQLIGIDNSVPMLEKARLKTELYSRQDSITYLLEDIMTLDRPGTGAFILNYTLQFVRPILRKTLIEKLYDNLKPGGILLLSEKTINHDKRLNRDFIAIYHDFKRNRGYSELEIARKREALENILIPFSLEENIALLSEAGFTGVTTYFQWFNFSSIIAIKPS